MERPIYEKYLVVLLKFDSFPIFPNFPARILLQICIFVMIKFALFTDCQTYRAEWVPYQFTKGRVI